MLANDTPTQGRKVMSVAGIEPAALRITHWPQRSDLTPNRYGLYQKTVSCPHRSLAHPRIKLRWTLYLRM